MNSMQRFSSILWVFSWFQKLFPLTCRSFYIWCNSIGQFLLLYPKQLESFLESNCPFLYFNCFPVVISNLTPKSLKHFGLYLYRVIGV
jgi:hypothetical protein